MQIKSIAFRVVFCSGYLANVVTSMILVLILYGSLPGGDDSVSGGAGGGGGRRIAHLDYRRLGSGRHAAAGHHLFNPLEAGLLQAPAARPDAQVQHQPLVAGPPHLATPIRAQVLPPTVSRPKCRGGRTPPRGPSRRRRVRAGARSQSCHRQSVPNMCLWGRARACGTGGTLRGAEASDGSADACLVR